MKQKKYSRVISAFVAAMFVLAMIPTFVFAAPADVAMATATVKDKTVTNLGTPATGPYDKDTIDTIGRGKVTLTPDEASNSDGTLVTNFTAPNTDFDMFVKFAKGDVPTHVDFSDETAYADEAIADGDYFVIYFNKDTDYNTYVIDVEVKAPATGGADSGSISGEGTVENPDLKVVLPTNLDFALNPYELGTNTEGSQVVTSDYIIVNKTEAPIQVSFDIEATLATGVSLVDDTSKLNKSDFDETKKDVFFAALVAKDMTGTINFSDADEDAATGTDDLTATGDYDAELDGGMFVFDPESKVGKLAFALDAATTTALADGDKGVGIFQFYAEMNTYAKWEDNDIEVEGDWTITPMRKTDFDEIVEDLVGMQAVPSETAPKGPGFPGTESKPIDYVRNSGAELKVPFNAAGGTVKVTSSSGTVFQASEYTFEDGVITVKGSKMTAIFGTVAPAQKVFKAVVTGGDAPGTYTININLLPDA